MVAVSSGGAVDIYTLILLNGSGHTNTTPYVPLTQTWSDYRFPHIICCTVRRQGRVVEDFILVGLRNAMGLETMDTAALQAAAIPKTAPLLRAARTPINGTLQAGEFPLPREIGALVQVVGRHQNAKTAET
jgi:hypothetical protein